MNISRFVSLLAILSLTGCATPHTTASRGFTGFIAYEGRQSTWPTSSAALTEVDFAIPAYLGLPSKSYHVIGFVVSEEPLSSEQRDYLLAIANKCPIHRALHGRFEVLTVLAQ